ncbi:MAG: hypothetical protein EBQ89_02235 [Alphaproteobacteria bacterium]|jgi:hypothetical protein|nr:hypothetical protein [Alphaproteobacteria bacterium]
MIDILIITPEITKGMKSIGSKCLLNLKKNMSVLEYQISQAQKINKISNITINIGFDYDKIISKLYRYKNINFLINNEYEHTNQAQNLITYINKYRPKNLLVINSGILIKDKIIDKSFLNNESKIFMLNKPKKNFTIGSSLSTNLEYLFFDMEQSWSEIVYFNNLAIDTFLSCDSSMFKQMYLFEAINFLLQKNIVFKKIYINKNNIMKINNAKDITSARIFI